MKFLFSPILTLIFKNLFRSSAALEETLISCLIPFSLLRVGLLSFMSFGLELICCHSVSYQDTLLAR